MAGSSPVQVRRDFAGTMIGARQVGAGSPAFADTNEEGAHLLAPDTRQPSQATPLSFAAQAGPAVPRFSR